MAASSNQILKVQDGCRESYPVAQTTHIYQGTLVFVNSGGYADDDTASGANRFAGIAVTEVDNSSGNNGDLNVEVYTEGNYELTVSSMTQAKVGTDAYASDNYTVTSGYASNAVKIGKLSGYVSSTKGIVRLAPNAQKQGEVVAVGAGMKIARGEVTLDGSNPTTVATGLATIACAQVTLKTTSAPGDDPSWVSVNYTGSDGNLDVYAWKNTGGTDPTLVASTNNTAVFCWVAVGT